MEIEADGFVLRPWAEGDEDALIRHADDREVWRNLTDRFPNPYERADAERWIASNPPSERPHNFAIVFEGEPVGGVGLEPLQDLGRRTAEVGYWVGRRFWGRGIATEALRRFTAYAWDRFDLVRLQAHVIAWNPASARVLEKAGYVFEARLARAISKDGQIADSLLYVKLRED